MTKGVPARNFKYYTRKSFNMEHSLKHMFHYETYLG